MSDNKINKLENLVEHFLKEENSTHGLRKALRNLKKEIDLFESHKEGNKKVDDNDSEGVRVQIGGGRHLKKGYINIDIIPPADIVHDVREGIPLEDDSVQLIFNEHFLEHIDYPISVKKVIEECHRILKPNGKLIIGVPDAELAIKKYVQRDKKFYEKMLNTWYKDRKCLDHFNTYIDLVNYIFRDQDDDDTYTPHLWAYDLEKLISLLKEAGFKKARKWKFDPEVAREKRKWGSVYVEGLK